MRREAFNVMHNIEDSWWYKGRAYVVYNVLDTFLKTKNIENVLDLGSGFGGMFPYLSKYGKVSAMELDEEARVFCQNRGYNQTFATSEEAFSEENFSLVGMFDVLEHVEDDKKIVGEIFKNITSGGHIVITVPAYNWLWSVHDVEHHHYRRYTAKHLKKILSEAGFVIEYSSYWNFCLFFPIAILRLLGFGGGESLGKPSFYDKFFKKIISIESFFIPKVSFPFGTGIVVIASKSK